MCSFLFLFSPFILFPLSSGCAFSFFFFPLRGSCHAETGGAGGWQIMRCRRNYLKLPRGREWCNMCCMYTLYFLIIIVAWALKWRYLPPPNHFEAFFYGQILCALWLRSLALILGRTLWLRLNFPGHADAIKPVGSKFFCRRFLCYWCSA